MTFTSALSQHPDTAEAAAEVVGQALEGLGGDDTRPDLAAVFCTRHHTDAFEELITTVRSLLAPGRLVGISASGIVGGPREVEDGPALSLWAGSLGGGPAPVPVRLEAVRTGEGTAIGGFPQVENPEDHTLLLLADPFTMPVAELLAALEGKNQRMPVIGGMASAALQPGANRLALDGSVYDSGAVGVLVPSSRARPLVSQGCRPIGEPMIVTRGQGSTIEELAGQPAYDRLRQVVAEAAPADKASLLDALHIGVVVDEHQTEFGRGDFLVRNVIGADNESGSITVGADINVGTTVQFHVQDASAADEDLRTLLGKQPEADGALLFTCNGRGYRLFDAPDHDAELVAGVVPGRAVAGMFCAGEIGPVGPRSFLHGFTASVVLFGR